MPELRLIDKLRELLLQAQGKEVSLTYLRHELKIDPVDPAWQSIRKLMLDLVGDKLVKPSGRNDGIYKVITQVKPVKVFGRERRPPIKINFPRDYNTMEEMSVVDDIIFRGGDLILIAGRSNYGKTAICLNLCGENITTHPVLMGNEYTNIDNEPSPRFLNRIDKMDWISWINGQGEDAFDLLPVFADYAEHVVKDRMNFIDWINLPGEYYMISPIMEGIKRALGTYGIGVCVIQKNPGAEAGRGDNPSKDFADVEILLDEYNESEILMTMGKIKESKRKVTGRAFAFVIEDGVKIMNFRELSRCSCNKGWRGNIKCKDCHGIGYYG